MGALIALAELLGAFGVRGRVRIRSFTDPDDACFSYGPFLNAGGEVCLTPKQHVRHGKFFIVTPEEKLEREAWQALGGTRLHTGRDRLPPPENEDEFYINSLVGCALIHRDGRALGRVCAVHNFGAQDILEIACRGSSYMLPFTRETAIHVAPDKGQILSACPDAYLPETLHRPSR